MLDNQSTSLLRARQSQRDVPDDNDAGENHLQKLPQVIVDMEQRVGSALLCLWSDLRKLADMQDPANVLTTCLLL